MAERASGSDVLNLYVLRRIYNKDHVGRGEAGVSRRENLHTTVTKATYLYLSKIVPLGNGGYGSSVVETALRLILFLTGSIGLEEFGEEFAFIVMDRSSVADRLEDLVKYLRSRTIH